MKTPYALSTDYALLFELIQDGSHCFGLLGYKQAKCDDPAVVYKYEGGYCIASNEIIRYLPARDNPTLQDFERICKQTNLRWIVPATLPQECQNCGEKVTMISTGEFCPICKEEQ